MPHHQENEFAGPHTDPVRAAQVTSALDRFLSRSLSDKDLPGPKHRQLSNALMSAIAAGVVGEGEKLPSETALTLMTPFSLGTVQKALRALMQDGFITRKPGVGTVVRAWRQSMARPLHCRFAGDDGIYVPVYPRVISRQPVAETGVWTDLLGATATITRIDRRIMIGDLFPVLTQFYVDTDRFPLFADCPVHDLETRNFKLLMAEQTGTPIARIQHRLKMVRPQRNMASQLDMSGVMHVLHIKAVAAASDGAPLYYQEFHIPPNDLELCIESQFDGITGI